MQVNCNSIDVEVLNEFVSKTKLNATLIIKFQVASCDCLTGQRAVTEWPMHSFTRSILIFSPPAEGAASADDQ